MTRVSLSTTIQAPRGAVWDHLSDLSSHSKWMKDALEVDFVSEATSGVGTTMDCKTPIGPFVITDRMVVTEWKDGQGISVRHHGAVRGRGSFQINADSSGGTRLTWNEDLTFPWWMGGPVGALLARPVLRSRFSADLTAFAASVEALPNPPTPTQATPARRMALSEAAGAFLVERHLATLATKRPDDSLHAVPVGFTYDRDAACAWVITSSGSAKIRNIESGSRACLCQVDGRRWLSFEGPATVHRQPEIVAEAVRRYSERYRVPRPNPKRVCIEVRVERIQGSV
jgi:F420H(2)-dependent biliverdin reductase